MGTTKWREPIVDPFLIPLAKDIKLISVDGFPHAGNDVFECNGMKDGVTIKFYLKVARQMGADIRNEVKILELLSNSDISVPRIIDSNLNYDYPYIATLEVKGERLSTILSTYEGSEVLNNSLKYMNQFGGSLAKIHSLEIIWDNVKPRKFHFHPDNQFLGKHNLIEVGKWLIENEPTKKQITFIHGDHHYANLLWKDNKVSAVIDWELCGMGWKEFDIAWSMILRPSQKFMKSIQEQEAFLQGYGQYNSFDRKALNYCRVLVYLYFYDIGKRTKDNVYADFVLKEIQRIMNE